MPPSSPARWLAVPCAFAALSACAQTVPGPAGPAPTAPPPPVLPFKSALEGYRPFVDQKPIPWKEANDSVRRRDPKDKP